MRIGSGVPRDDTADVDVRCGRAEPVGDQPGLNPSEYGSDVEINVPANADDLVRLHSGTECCICLDPYKAQRPPPDTPE